MSDRGMKKWTAFRALVEQTTSLTETRRKKTKIEKPIISSDLAEDINRILVNYHGEELLITHYKDGYLYEIQSKISRIDIENRLIILPDRTRILLKNLTNLKFFQ